MKLSQIKKTLASILTVCMLLSMFVVVSAENVLTLKAESLLTIETDGDTKTVIGLAENTTVADFVANFENSEAVVVSKDNEALSERALVGTGAVVSIEEDSAYVVVKGDTDGSGLVDSTDYLQIKSYFLETLALEGLFFNAADTNSDKEITTTDYIQIKSYFLGIFNLYPEVEEEPSEAPSEEESSEESEEISSEEPSSEATSEEASSEEAEYTYIVHKKNGKIHIPTCSGAQSMSEANKVYYNCTLDELLAQGFVPCGTCNAGMNEESSEASSEEASSEEPSSEEPSSEESSEEASSEALEIVTEPQVDTAYKFALNQATVGKNFYFTGEKSGNFLATSELKEDAVDVYLEAAEGGYYLSFVRAGVKQYINIVEREDKAGSQTISLGETAITVYKLDETLNVLYTTLVFASGSSQDYYLGTYNSFTTISSSKISYITGDNASKIGVSQFPAYLVK